MNDRSHRPAPPIIRLRLIVVAPPPGVTFAVQRGRSDLLPPTEASARQLVFDLEAKVADLESDPPRLTGEFMQGPPSGRFIYVNSGTLAGQPGSPWTRRAKVPVYGISAELIRSALKGSRMLQASIAGTGRGGGPACASVPLLSNWDVIQP